MACKIGHTMIHQGFFVNMIIQQAQRETLKREWDTTLVSHGRVNIPRITHESSAPLLFAWVFKVIILRTFLYQASIMELDEEKFHSLHAPYPKSPSSSCIAWGPTAHMS